MSRARDGQVTKYWLAINNFKLMTENTVISDEAVNIGVRKIIHSSWWKKYANEAVANQATLFDNQVSVNILTSHIVRADTVFSNYPAQNVFITNYTSHPIDGLRALTYLLQREIQRGMDESTVRSSLRWLGDLESVLQR